MWILPLIKRLFRFRSSEVETDVRPDVQHGRNGRPSYVVSRDQLELLLDLNFTNQEIADLVHISVSSVKRRLRYVI